MTLYDSLAFVEWQKSSSDILRFRHLEFSGGCWSWSVCVRDNIQSGHVLEEWKFLSQWQLMCIPTDIWYLLPHRIHNPSHDYFHGQILRSYFPLQLPWACYTEVRRFLSKLSLLFHATISSFAGGCEVGQFLTYLCIIILVLWYKTHSIKSQEEEEKYPLL